MQIANSILEVQNPIQGRDKSFDFPSTNNSISTFEKFAYITQLCHKLTRYNYGNQRKKLSTLYVFMIMWQRWSSMAISSFYLWYYIFTYPIGAFTLDRNFKLRYTTYMSMTKLDYLTREVFNHNTILQLIKRTGLYCRVYKFNTLQKTFEIHFREVFCFHSNLAEVYKGPIEKKS